jgi:Uma2 family endonuclease
MQRPESHGITVAPDWVCEVISPSSVRTDRVFKMPRYAEFDVKFLWLIDPIVKTLEAYKLDGGGWRLLSNHSGDDKIRVEPFHEIEFDLARLWWE